jgi:phytoene dehydrogenase-like protein
VRLADGEDVAADAVVSTVSAGVLAPLLPSGALPGRLHRRLRIWRYGTAPFKLDYALSGPVAWTATEPRSAGVVHVGGALEELARAADAGQRGDVPERPALVVGQQSLHDPTRAPAGQQTLYVYAHVPADYAESDDAVAERIEAQLERFAPGFASLVLDRSMRTPAQTEQENPSLVGGDLAGGSYELDQQLLFRPDPRLCRYRTPLRGLYMAGASTHPGGAVHGMSGRGAARALLRDRRLRRA